MPSCFLFLDDPLYAVTTLIGRRYTEKKRETDLSGTRYKNTISRGEMAMNDKTYEQYLTPIEGLPGEKPVSPTQKYEDDSAYLEPVGGIPVPVCIFYLKLLFLTFGYNILL